MPLRVSLSEWLGPTAEKPLSDVFVVFVNAGAYLEEACFLGDTDGCGIVWNDLRQNFRRSRLKSKSGEEPERCTGCAMTSSARCDAIAYCDAVETERCLEAARTYDAGVLVSDDEVRGRQVWMTRVGLQLQRPRRNECWRQGPWLRAFDKLFRDTRVRQPLQCWP
jgi:hypothetical protein